MTKSNLILQLILLSLIVFSYVSCSEESKIELDLIYPNDVSNVPLNFQFEWQTNTDSDFKFGLWNISEDTITVLDTTLLTQSINTNNIFPETEYLWEVNAGRATEQGFFKTRNPLEDIKSSYEVQFDYNFSNITFGISKDSTWTDVIHFELEENGITLTTDNREELLQFKSRTGNILHYINIKSYNPSFVAMSMDMDKKRMTVYISSQGQAISSSSIAEFDY